MAKQIVEMIASAKRHPAGVKEREGSDVWFSNDKKSDHGQRRS
jgi:hypothetical protein